MKSAKTHKVQEVMGQTMPPARLTGWGYAYILLYLGLPLLALLAVLDGIFYLIARFMFDTCYGIFCLL